jgi:hypothetical protein
MAVKQVQFVIRLVSSIDLLFTNSAGSAECFRKGNKKDPISYSTYRPRNGVLYNWANHSLLSLLFLELKNLNPLNAFLLIGESDYSDRWFI